MTKGGVMIGSTESTRSSFLCRNCVRVAISAKASPRPVQATAQATASASVFHATPQRVPPPMQPSPQILAVNKRSVNAPREKPPSVPSTAESRILMTGKNVNTATSTATVTTLPATKPSPLKNPRKASPSANSIANAVMTSAAPRPMPYWLPAAPNRLPSNSKAKPRGPIAKPCPSVHATPAEPTASSRLPWARRGSPGSSASAAAARSNATGQSQARPCSVAWSTPGAASREANAATQAGDSTDPCSMYQGTSRNPAAPTASQASRGCRGPRIVSGVRGAEQGHRGRAAG